MREFSKVQLSTAILLKLHNRGAEAYFPVNAAVIEKKRLSGAGRKMKQKDVGEQTRGLKAFWEARRKKRRGSLVPFQTQGSSACHQDSLYCQTRVTVMGTVGPGSSAFFHSSQFPEPGPSILVTRWRDVVSDQVRQSLSCSCSLTHSLTLSLFAFFFSNIFARAFVPVSFICLIPYLVFSLNLFSLVQNPTETCQYQISNPHLHLCSWQLVNNSSSDQHRCKHNISCCF